MLVASAMVIVPAAHAAPEEPPGKGPDAAQEQLYDLFDAVPAAEVAAAVEEFAEEEGVSPASAADQMLEEAHAAEIEDVFDLPGYGKFMPTPTKPRVLARSSDGGGSDRVRLPDARQRGDYFYHHSSTYGFNHGHVGLFRRKDLVVEAANANLGVRLVETYKRTVPRGATVLIELAPASYALRDSATAWAKGQEGAGYRSFTQLNKTFTAPFNCSQLVWAAFAWYGVLLDGNGGDYVYPRDLLEHNWSQPYLGV